MVEVRKDHWKSPVPTPLLIQLQLSWLPRTVSTQFLSISKEADSITSLDLCQCLVTLTGQTKKCLLMAKGISCLHQLPLVLVLGTTGKIVAPSFLHPSFSYLCTLTDLPWAFSPSGWTAPALLGVSHRRWMGCSSFIISVTLCWTLSMSLMHWVVQNWVKHSGADWRGRISFHLLGNVSIIAAQDTGDLLWGKGTWACGRYSWAETAFPDNWDIHSTFPLLKQKL